MFSAASNYLQDLAARFGSGWNEFWYRPRDPFAVCLLRVLCGLMALYVVGTYSWDLVLFFGPQGILPPEAVTQLNGPDVARVSYLDPMRQPGELYAAHAVGLAILALSTVGLWSRVTSVLAWLVVLAYIQRAPLLVGQTEQVLAFVMFYLCFAPTGKALSVDAWLAKRRNRSQGDSVSATAAPEQYFSATVATRLIQLHLAAVYILMGVAKLAGVEEATQLTWWRGDAVWWLAVRPDTPLFDLTGFLARHSYLTNAWTHLIVAFELTFGILIWNRLARPLLLGLAVPMWLSLAVLTGLLPISLMMLIANLAFFEPSYLRKLRQK